MNNEKVPYYDLLVNDYYQKKISPTVFNQLLLQDAKLREWYEYHQWLEKSLKDYCFLDLEIKQKGSE